MHFLREEKSDFFSCNEFPSLMGSTAALLLYAGIFNCGQVGRPSSPPTSSSGALTAFKTREKSKDIETCQACCFLCSEAAPVGKLRFTRKTRFHRELKNMIITTTENVSKLTISAILSPLVTDLMKNMISPRNHQEESRNFHEAKLAFETKIESAQNLRSYSI
ncbi:hypothetical protein TNCV_693841 [Trichonephila clavipes]|nr:hypothetical protein TNCV_693841 [Trichonephila clavipes]